jgi:Domain of unknown function (DUF4249)
MNNRFRILLKTIQFSLLTIFFSCLTPIEVPVNLSGGKLVVSGQVSTLSDQNIIQLGITAETYRLPLPLSGAFINLTDEEGRTLQYEEDPFIPGSYLLNNYSGVNGKEYFIEIFLPNGRKYKSQVEKMPEPSSLDEVSYKIEDEKVTDFEGIVTNKSFYKIHVRASYSNNAYIKWTVRETFLFSPTDFPDPFGNIPPPCFIDQKADPQRVTLFNGNLFKEREVNNILVTTREIDWTFHERHYFTTYQSTLTKASFEYWNMVNILANQVGSIFDTPPAEIKGNLFNVNNPDEKVLGFFQAVNQSFKRKSFFESDLPNPLPSGKCDFNGSYNDFDYPSRCIDCTTVRNSSYKRPIWFGS